MEYTQPMGNSEEGEPIIVKADEVDEAGADISTIPSTDTSASEFNDRIETRRAHDAQPGGSPKVLANAAPSPPRLQPLSRPILRRESSTPAPPQQPPPSAPFPKQEGIGNNADPVSLSQLKQIVAGLPKPHPTAYAYEYAETLPFPEELQEWFQYSEHDTHSLLRSKHTFIQTWERAHSERPEPSDEALEWTDVEEEDRIWFIKSEIKGLESSVPASRLKSLECLCYIALGVWGDTAVTEYDQIVYDSLIGQAPQWFESQNSKSKLQQCWIIIGVRLLAENGVISRLLGLIRNFWDIEQADDSDEAGDDEQSQLRCLELEYALTILYVLIEVARGQPTKDLEYSIRKTLATHKVDLLLLLTQMIAKHRWEDVSNATILPRQRLLLIFWKTSLLIFGTFDELERNKTKLRKEFNPKDEGLQSAVMTASPLDYHLFRQEITSKYPAYNPPPPLLPIELENNSILPPLPNHPSRHTVQDDLHNVVSGNPNASGSILNQAVHIATPAPSPPPSPAGPGGKGGKKQNYQTNQNFPFLYPPLDELEGKETMKLDSNPHRVARSSNSKWDEYDVPASILEAGQLFSSRMRMSRSIKQLWDVRESYIRAERGWNDPGDQRSDISDDSDFELDTELQTAAPLKAAKDLPKRQKSASHGTETGIEKEIETEDEDAQRQLDAIRGFYRNALPDMQSFIIVLFKELFQNVQALILQNGPNGVANGASEDGANEGQGKRKTNPNSSVSLSNMVNGQLGDVEDGHAPALEGLNEIRSREISSKAVSGILLALLKWFKFSHIMKFEYLTQLLLDANFLPLLLKYFAHQDIDKAVEQKNDRDDLDFFSFCQFNSNQPPSIPPQRPLSSSESSNSGGSDEAIPPPISRHRRSPTYHSPPPISPPPLPPGAGPGSSTRPEVDELGFPTSGNLPTTPLTTYAPRFFLTNINLLRLMQKITKRKAHRALLLVQYKSSTILRKALKIPQPDLRLYTLKLFKSQVPYCGRKWRQTNMRVITAIYLHCRPTLRDEWLCGGDVDGVVEEALPLEQAGRSLVHWWHLRHFRDIMEGAIVSSSSSSSQGTEGGKEEYDFFARELDKLGWGFGVGAGLGGMGGGMEEEEAYLENAGGPGGAEVGRTEFEGGPLQMEGWA